MEPHGDQRVEQLGALAERAVAARCHHGELAVERERDDREKDERIELRST